MYSSVFSSTNYSFTLTIIIFIELHVCFNYGSLSHYIIVSVVVRETIETLTRVIWSICPRMYVAFWYTMFMTKQMEMIINTKESMYVVHAPMQACHAAQTST